MSNELRSLLERVDANDPSTAKELRRHIEVLQGRRQFGLNFERHTPESVALTGRPISVGDKVSFLPPRGETEVESKANWVVTGIFGPRSERVASLLDPRSKEETRRALEDLVFVADFRDPIYPGLESTGKVERGGDKPFHTVINAENYHALEAMLFTYQGKVDCIYIDPPYNTRANDWKYNNDYVDPGDSYGHSKWLAFMERRLKLASKLLHPRDSVLIVTIDEKEVHRMGLLLEQIFPGQTIQMVSIVINPLGQERARELARVEEYAFFVFIGEGGASPVKDDLLALREEGPETEGPETEIEQLSASVESNSEGKVRWERLIRGGAAATRRKSPHLFYPVFIDPETRRVHSVGSALPPAMDRTEITAPLGTVCVWPIRKNGSEGRWRCSPEYFESLLKRGYAKVGAYNKASDKWTLLYLGKAQIQRVESGEIEVRGTDDDGSVILGPAPRGTSLVSAKTIWNRASHKAGKYGSELVGQLIPGREFPFPKSLYAVEDSLRLVVASKPDALVLDFFAGSGTTAHALMRLNHQDNGQRRSVSVTNNEVNDQEKSLLRAGLRPGDSAWEAEGICERVTKPRIQAAVTGETPEGNPIAGSYKFVDPFPMAAGFEENVEFFTLTYENPALVELDMSFERIAPLLWMRAGSEGRRIDERNDSFAVADSYAVLFNVDASSPFLAAVDKANDLRVIYIVTDDETQYQAVAGQLPDGVESVQLYESYLRTFQINTGRA